MSFDQRVGIAGLIVGLFAIAAAILWPDRKWIGWLALAACIALLVWWGWLEFAQKILATQRHNPIAVGAFVFVAGGCIAVALWLLMGGTRQAPRAEATEAGPRTGPTANRSATTGVQPSVETPHTEQPKKKPAHNELAGHPAPAAPTAQPPTIIETAPVFGNLHDRATALSDEIMEDLYMHGWKNGGGKSGGQGLPRGMQMPTDAAGIQNWTRSRAAYFRFRFFERVLDLRNEFAQLHLRDQRLDDFFKYQGMVEEANRQMVAAGNAGAANNVGLLLPQEIEDVAEQLKILAKQLPVQRAAPKPLRFSVTRVQPEKPDIPFEIVVTIQADTNAAEGYIAVEFDGPKASVSTDFVGSRLVFDQESLAGNKPLLDYLRSHSPGDIYLLEIGSAPLMTKKPIHVIAYGGTEFRVVSVSLFDK